MAGKCKRRKGKRDSIKAAASIQSNFAGQIEQRHAGNAKSQNATGKNANDDKRIEANREAKKTKSAEISALTNETTAELRPPFNFAPEIVDEIIKHTVTFNGVIPVDPRFYRQSKHLPPAADYRILHVARGYYQTGIRHYYERNTFSIELKSFLTEPDTLAPKNWPHGCGLGCASMFVRNIHISARQQNNWDDSIALMKGFEGLQKVVFDTRDALGIDEGPDGGVKFEPWHKDEKGWHHGGWAVVPASKGLCEVIRASGVNIPAGGIWVGATTEEYAEAQSRALAQQLRVALELERAAKPPLDHNAHLEF